MGCVFVTECALRLLASLVCAIVLGIERKRGQHSVGLRTIILISLSCTLLCMLSTYLSRDGAGRGDPTRVAAGVVTGIGFLGGGAIMRQGLNIRGLTSAAVIWMTAALALACGAGLFIPAAIVLCASLVTLITLERTEGHYSSEKTKSVWVTYKCNADEGADSTNAQSAAIAKVLESMLYTVRDINIEADKESGTMTIEYSVKAPPNADPIALVQSIAKDSRVEHVSVNDAL